MALSWDLNIGSLTPEIECATAALYCCLQGKQERGKRNKRQRSNTFEVYRLRQHSVLIRSEFKIKVLSLKIRSPTSASSSWIFLDLSFLISKMGIKLFLRGFPGGSVVKNLPAMQETQVQSLNREDSPGGRNGYPLQYSCLENPMDRETWWATVHEPTKSRTWLSN